MKPTRSGDGYDPQTTIFGYDTAGRPSTVMQPDGGVVTTEYYPTGAVRKVTGARTYPEERTYDSQGRQKTLKTWKDYASDTGAAVTTWNYNPQRGWLDNKRYADNTGPSYTYKPSGRLLTRTWARGIVTTYGYSTGGEPNAISYSDATPAVSISYDRLGRPKSRADAAGLCAWSYHPSGQLQDEIYSSGLLNGLSVARGFDSLSRISSLSATSASSVLNQMSFGYDSASRLSLVTQGTNTATYSYVPNSPLVGTITFAQSGVTRLTTTKVYDNLNRLSSITNTPSASSVSSAAYSYNAANQRMRATREDSSYWQYEYDSLGQVTAGRKHLSSDATISGLDFGWSFDDIGNRKTSTVNSQISNYTVNPLNQYSQRTILGVIDVMGEAQADATVTVTVGSGLPQPVTRQGGLFFKQVPVDNATAAQQTSIKVTGVKNLVGPNQEDAVTEIPKSAFIARSPEAFTHDADGNLTNDAKWTYTWDGENRLATMETQPTAVTAGVARQKLEFAYDAQGRRISKKVFSWSGSAYTLASSTLFLYDGWNLIAELDALNGNAPARTYAWGLDLSGSMQGAGGVEGLIFANLGSATHAPAYDGNGNVIALVDMATGAKSATYEYGAFGETIISDGPAAEAMPFKFSTKYTDPETSLLYYGLRYYSPGAGRWISRDPIAEKGGVNVYGFVRNDAVNDWDLLGLVDCESPCAKLRGIVNDLKKSNALFKTALEAVLFQTVNVYKVQEYESEFGGLSYRGTSGYKNTALSKGVPGSPELTGKYYPSNSQLSEIYRNRGLLVGVAHGHPDREVYDAKLSLGDYRTALGSNTIITAVTPTGHLFVFDPTALPYETRKALFDAVTAASQQNEKDGGGSFPDNYTRNLAPEIVKKLFDPSLLTECPDFFSSLDK